MPRNKYPEETRQKILNAALKLFLEKGFEQTTVLDIVDHMGGLTRGAFYHHFKSKEEVLDAIGDQMFRESNPFEQIKGKNELSGLEKLKTATLSRLIDDGSYFGMGVTREQCLALTKVSLNLLKEPRFLMEQLKANHELTEMIEPLVAEGMADGSIHPGNSKLLAEFLVLLVNFWVIPTIFPCSEEEMAEKATIIKQTLDALGIPLFNESFTENALHFFKELDAFSTSKASR